MTKDDTTESEECLKRILEAAARVYAALDAPPAPRPSHGLTLRDVEPWLAAPRLNLTFRTQRSANLAALQFAANGYPAHVGQHSVFVEAPWFLVAAVVSGVGLTSEVLAIENGAARPDTRLRSPRGHA
jgi:hypothetical protein